MVGGGDGVLLFVVGVLGLLFWFIMRRSKMVCCCCAFGDVGAEAERGALGRGGAESENKYALRWLSNPPASAAVAEDEMPVAVVAWLRIERADAADAGRCCCC